MSHQLVNEMLWIACLCLALLLAFNVFNQCHKYDEANDDKYLR